jgi:hypothetical protein
VRQKVKPYFLCGRAAFCYAKPAFGCPAAFGLVPVWLAKKDKQSSSFFGEKTRQTLRADWFFVVFTRFEARLCLVSNPNYSGKK